MTGSKFDLLGLGLVGNSGLLIYLVFLAAVAAVIWLVIRAITRGLVWTRPIQRLVLRLPGIGGPLQTFALARLAWTMHLTMNTSMDVRRSLQLCLRSTQNARYIDQIPAIDAAIASGGSIHEAFLRAGGYPAEFLDTLAVGEQSGKVVESMGQLARQYQERAQNGDGGNRRRGRRRRVPVDRRVHHRSDLPSLLRVLSWADQRGAEDEVTPQPEPCNVAVRSKVLHTARGRRSARDDRDCGGR